MRMDPGQEARTGAGCAEYREEIDAGRGFRVTCGRRTGDGRTRIDGRVCGQNANWVHMSPPNRLQSNVRSSRRAQVRERRDTRLRKGLCEADGWRGTGRERRTGDLGSRLGFVEAVEPRQRRSRERRRKGKKSKERGELVSMGAQFGARGGVGNVFFDPEFGRGYAGRRVSDVTVKRKLVAEAPQRNREPDDDKRSGAETNAAAEPMK
jgi:hypothetical protein